MKIVHDYKNHRISAEAVSAPRGCADPTFTGAGFDVATIALQGVRLVVGTLAGSIPGGYPD